MGVPVARVGLALALLTGPALLAVKATEYVENPFLWAKFGAIAVGLANLGALHGSAAWRSADDGASRRTAVAGAASRWQAAFPSRRGSPPSPQDG